jgi:hypothetical protein
MTDMTITFEQELLEAARQLDKEGQRRILAYARALRTRPKGLSGQEFLERTKDIHIDPDDLRRMEQAIEEAFEQVSNLPEVRFDA